MAVVGSMAGNLVLFTVARKGGKRFLERTAEPGRSRRFRNWFDRYGLVTVFIPALVPIPLPLKVFVVSAGALRMRYRTFMVVMLTARVLRYFGEAWLGVKLGQESTRYLRDHAWNLAGSALALALALYLLVRFSDRYRKTASA